MYDVREYSIGENVDYVHKINGLMYDICYEDFILHSK